MEDLLHDTGLVASILDAELPETLLEAEDLASSIERAVQQETGRRVRDLSVEVNEDGVLLKGRCTTYHCKQLAQHAALAMAGDDRLTNSIEVI